jgi:hypothetical protein
MITPILLVFAFVLAVIATFTGYPGAQPNNPWYWRFNFLAAALAFYFLSLLLETHLAH